MSERTSHPPGAFSWTDLSTSDAEGAKSFYGPLFGWEFQDLPAGEGMTYTMASRDGHAVAAVAEQTSHPPHWNSYVTVADADETAGRVEGLGGKLVEPPFDVLGAGRMALLQDPAGAMLCLWQAKEHIGAGVVNQPGALTWNDLTTPDVAAAAEFYGRLFGWTTEEIPDSGGYRIIRNGERTNGGMQPPRVEGAPAAWIPYFGHDDVERAAEQVSGGGGRVLAGPIRMPSGSIIVATDPQGAAFAVWSGSYDD